MSVYRNKIAIFGIKTYPAFAGADRVVENILENMGGKYEYHIYLINTANKVSSANNKHFIYLPALPGKHLKAFSFYVLCTLHMLFRKKYDLIHAHNSDVGLFTYILRLKYSGKIIGTFHGNPYESSKWGKIAKIYLKISERLFIASCDKLTSVSDIKKVNNKKILFIPNGIEKIKAGMFDNYKNTTVDYEEMKIQKGRYILFACGRIYKSKGLDHLLDAYSTGSIHNQLVIIGDFSHDKNYREEINAKIDALAGIDVVVFKKLLPKHDLFDVIINSKLVVFPSENEAMSMFLMEVLACEKIVVSSDIEANIKILGKDYKYLFENKNVTSLSSVIKIALQDIDQDAALHEITTMKVTMLRKYRWKSIVKDYSQLYNSFFLQEV